MAVRVAGLDSIDACFAVAVAVAVVMVVVVVVVGGGGFLWCFSFVRWLGEKGNPRLDTTWKPRSRHRLYGQDLDA